MQKSLLYLLAPIVLLGAGCSSAVQPAPGPQPVACTMEAKLCPDGSYVGRSGPNCEFAACPPYTPKSGDTLPVYVASGVMGKVLLGPTCPVEMIPPDPQCADKLYQTTIEVTKITYGKERILLQGESDVAGNYRIVLEPGSYTLKAGGNKMLPRCAPVEVVVKDATYAVADISCDTGIR